MSKKSLIGGTEYNVVYHPNLSAAAKEQIISRCNSSASSDDTYIYDVEVVSELISLNSITLDDDDKQVIEAMNGLYAYFEI